MASPRKINAISLEFNDCLYSEGFKFYHRKREQDEDPFIKANHRLLNILAEKIAQDAEEAHVFIGSERQDPHLDKAHSGIKQTPSVVHGLGTLVPELTRRVYDLQKNINVVPEQFMLGDAFFKYPDNGDDIEDNTFAAIQNSLNNDGRFVTNAFNQQVSHSNKALSDQSYVLTLYAQMHRLASQHPNDDIEFDFYHHDDDVLDEIHSFFNAHKDLLPGSVNLQLFQYRGEFDDKFAQGNQQELALKAEEAVVVPQGNNIQGEGAIDYNYKRNIHRMANSVGVNPQIAIQNDQECNIAQSYANNRRALRDFNKRRQLIGQVLTRDGLQKKLIDREHLDGDFNPHLMIKDLHQEIDQLKAHLGNDLDMQVNTEFVTALNSLCDDIAEDLTAQAKSGISPVLIRQSHAMQVAKNTQRLVSDLQSNELNKNSKLDLIDSYMKNNQKKTGFFKNFLKGIAVVAIAAAGFVVGAVIGAGIGIAAGAWSGPGAAATGLLGLFTGAFTGAAAGVAAGAAVTGLGAGALSAWLLFRKDKISKGVTNVGEKSKLFQPPVAEEAMRLNPRNDSEEAPALK